MVKSVVIFYNLNDKKLQKLFRVGYYIRCNNSSIETTPLVLAQ